MPRNIHFPQSEIDKIKALNDAELKAMLESPRATEHDRIYARLGLAITGAWFQWELEEISGKSLADVLPPVERILAWMLADLLGSMETTVGEKMEIVRDSARTVGDLAVQMLARHKKDVVAQGIVGGNA